MLSVQKVVPRVNLVNLVKARQAEAAEKLASEAALKQKYGEASRQFWADDSVTNSKLKDTIGRLWVFGKQNTKNGNIFSCAKEYDYYGTKLLREIFFDDSLQKPRIIKTYYA